MREFQDMIFDVLNDDLDLRALLGAADRVSVAKQAQRVVNPCVTISQNSSNKMISEVKEIWRVEYILVAWDKKSDIYCELLGKKVQDLLDEGLVSNSEVLIQGCDVNSLTGPYWDPAEESWRKDLRLEIIGQLK